MFRQVTAGVAALVVALASTSAIAQQEVATWRIQNLTKSATIVEYQVVFTAKNGQQLVIPKTAANIGPMVDFDVKALGGLCVVRIEGVVHYVDKERAANGSQQVKLSNEDCMQVEHLKLVDSK